MSDTVVRSRIDAQTKARADRIFRELGLTMSDAIRLFLRQAVARQGLPFPVRLSDVAPRASLAEPDGPDCLRSPAVDAVRPGREPDRPPAPARGARSLEAAFESARLEGQPLSPESRDRLLDLARQGLDPGQLAAAVRERWGLAPVPDDPENGRGGEPRA